MVDYSKLSDLEINARVSYVLHGAISRNHKQELDNGDCDYCNNPADAWAIISDNKITLIACSDSWIACPYGSVIDGDTSEPQILMYAYSRSKATCFADANPLRAAMIVFLMMQDAKNG